MKSPVDSLVSLIGSLLVSILVLCPPCQGDNVAKSFFDLRAPSIDSKVVDFKTYAGKVTLVVNVASQCGYTHQYAGLEKLYEQYKQRGFLILGFPSNDFGSQEPGSNQEIKKFCKLKYDVQFPVFAKDHVTGTSKSPVYQYLTAYPNLAPAGEVLWNFEKFLINRQGQLVKRFRSETEPEDPALVNAIETEVNVSATKGTN